MEKEDSNEMEVEFQVQKELVTTMTSRSLKNSGCSTFVGKTEFLTVYEREMTGGNRMNNKDNEMVHFRIIQRQMQHLTGSTRSGKTKQIKNTVNKQMLQN